MDLFARFHIHGYGGRSDFFRSSNFITYDLQGNARYHLIPLLFLGLMVLLVAMCFWAMARREEVQAWANRPLDLGFFLKAVVVIGGIWLACYFLTRFPQFVWM
jgi:hypothetical protein